MFNSSRPARGYALLWPRELFRAELADILAHVGRSQTQAALELLFAEALRGPDPLEDLQSAPSSYATTDPWTGETTFTTTADPARDLADQILAHVDRLPTYEPRRYFSARQAADDQEPKPAYERPRWSLMQRRWAATLEQLVDAGYLDRLAGDRCEDHKDNEQPKRINQLVVDHCGYPDQWPLTFDAGDYHRDHFLTLVEVFHDLVARPRLRHWHDYDEHYWYEQFDEAAGQAVYRWKVNQLFDRHLINYQLAADGEDAGFVVRAVAGPRRELLQQVQQHVPDGNENRVAHAVSLFRRRESTLEDKRSACKALADVLENRRPLIEANLNSKDAGDLFLIANKFGIRHHDGKQRLDYPDDYLDWIFWWYLATVELTNRLIAKAQPGE